MTCCKNVGPTISPIYFVRQSIAQLARYQFANQNLTVGLILYWPNINISGWSKVNVGPTLTSNQQFIQHPTLCSPYTNTVPIINKHIVGPTIKQHCGKHHSILCQPLPHISPTTKQQCRGDWGWLGQVLVGTVPPPVPNELPDGETNYVFGEQVTTAFTGATCIIDARFASEISPKITF